MEENQTEKPASSVEETNKRFTRVRSVYQKSFLARLGRPGLFMLAFALVGFGALAITRAGILDGADFKVFYAVEDSYVRSDLATQTNGNSPRLSVRDKDGSCLNNSPGCSPRNAPGTNQSYVKFNIDAVPSGKRVARVIVRMRTAAGDGASEQGGRLYQARSNTWSESTLNWNNAPGAQATELSRVGVTRHDKWYNFEVTAANNPIMSGGTFSFVITNSSKNESVWQSSETINRPMVLVFYENVPSPPPPPTNISTIRIATLGDSQTASGSWRRVFQDRLRASSCSYDMVGQFDWNNPPYDEQTDARPGATVRVVDPNNNVFLLGTNSVNSQPHIVHVLAGTNDIAYGGTGDAYVRSVISALSVELNRIANTSPGSLILVSAIPPTIISGTANSTLYNTLQIQLVDQMKAAGRNISFYDPQFLASDMNADGVHLTSAGQTKLGQAAYAAGQQFVSGSGACGQTSHHETCTIGQLGQHGPCINRSLIPAAQAGASTVRMGACLPVPNSSTYCSNGLGEQSAFRTQCNFSHMNNDDPVLYLNQPGIAHLHAFFGNTGANAASTSTSLMTSGNSTCRGGIFNRSAYWAPAMVDRTTGRPIAPGSNSYPALEAYYKLGYQGIAPSAVQPFPNGLQMIAGNPATATTAPTGINPPTVYYCDGQSGGNRILGPQLTSIPSSCPVGHSLTMHIKFPQCWDGRNLTSPNGRTHMAYGTWGVGCPATHPVGFPFVEMLIRYQVPADGNLSNWRLASDRYTNGPGGYSGHADYVFAWDASAFPTVIQRCHQAQQDCKYQLGDGREPIF